MRNDAPFCTVIIPCFNKGPYIARAIQSVLAQAQNHLHVLVLDDGSTDRSFEEASRIASDDGRVRVRTRPNQGPVATVNELSAHVTSPFWALLDGDDFWHPHRFQWAMDDFAKDDTLIASFCGMETVNAEDDNINLDQFHAVDLVGVEVVKRLVVANCLPASSAFVRTSALKKLNGPFRPCSEIYDWDLWLRLAVAGTLKMRAGIGIAYRKHAGNRSAMNRDLLAAQEYAAQQELFPQLQAKYDLNAEVEANVQGSMGQRCFQLKNYARAALHYLKKAKFAPLYRNEAEQLAKSLLSCNRVSEARSLMASLGEMRAS